MAAAESLSAMQAVSVGPDDSVSQIYFLEFFEHGMDVVVQRRDNGVLDVVADLPTDASSRLSNANDLWNDFLVGFYKIVESTCAVIFLGHTIGWRCDSQSDGVVRNLTEKIEA